MKKLLTYFFVIAVSNYIIAQDYRVQKPAKNFEHLWRKFDKRYASFEYKKVDWKMVYDQYRPLIGINTTNDSLFSVCNDMLSELKDGHVNLINHKRGKVIRQSDDAAPSALTTKFATTRETQPNVYQLFETTKATLVENSFKQFKLSKSQLIRYSVSDDYGYLLISAMQGFKFGELGKFLDKALKEFVNKQGVIIDVRTNGGGMDLNSHKISGRFADKKRIAYYKHQRKKGKNTYRRLKTKYLRPSGKLQFTKPIIILTSDHTASAADVFALMMKELPYVTVIGDRTSGIFSDMYGFKLPNGWFATLSHQQYFSTEMKNLEGIGVQPDIKLLNEPMDIKNNVDPLILKALDLLNKKNRED